MFIKYFSELSNKDTNIAGGKGASLGEMTQAGIPVPPGFVILSTAFEKVLKGNLTIEIESILHSVDHKKMHTVEGASEKIQALILNTEIPEEISEEIKRSFKKLNAKYVAIRSSATAEDSFQAAWAGQLETYLNTTEKDLLINVKKCWASLFTPRAIFYRFDKGLHKSKISVAVIVQKMIESEIAGVAFSVHPVTSDYDQMVIEAGYGLGEAIVSGNITPDTYIVGKQESVILDKKLSIQKKKLIRSTKGGNMWMKISSPRLTAKLTDKELMTLSKLVTKIETHYGFPVDVEWTLQKHKFHIVQSRPITTLTGTKVEDRDPTVIDGVKWNLTVTRNASFFHFYASALGHFHNSKDFGVKSPNEWIIVTLRGTQSQLFVNPDNMNRYVAAVMATVSSKKRVKELKNKYRFFSDSLLQALGQALNSLSPKDWQVFAKEYIRFTAGLNITVVIGRRGAEILVKKLEERDLKKTKVAETLAAITYPRQHTPLFDSRIDLLLLGAEIQNKSLPKPEVNKALKEWLRKYGHIPVNFCDRPWVMKDAGNQLKELLKGNCQEEIDLLVKSHADRIRKGERLLKTLNSIEISSLAYALQEGTYINEFRKNIFSKVSLEMRKIFAEAAKRANLKSWQDCYYLTPEEIGQALGKTGRHLKKTVSGRKAVGAKMLPNGRLEFLPKEVLNELVRYIRSMQGRIKLEDSGVKVVKGMSANTGVIKGIVKIILGSRDFNKLLSGEILVTTMTSVDFIPVMERAAAFVTNEGGITSHAAIVAREMNKPCIIGTGNATKVFKDGDIVEVDANNGVVKLIERA